MQKSKNVMNPHIVIKEQISEELKSNRKIFGLVIKAVAEPIIEKRVKWVVAGLEKIDQLEQELKSIKPDTIQYPVGPDNKPLPTAAPAMVSEAQYKKIAETNAKLEKLYIAFQKAIPTDGSVPDYGPLEKEVGKK